MGMRMMFTVFLLVVLATTVVSFTSRRGPKSRRGEPIPTTVINYGECCKDPSCWVKVKDFQCPGASPPN
uniref:G054 VD Superfamily A precursor conopeptide n=1 Tax=Conus geographus TaxID=6491 RepID=X5I9Y9_CONGE|nr:G054_VD_Superfamily_A_precursor_conopeptide [Conus geographus]